jgi:hypothetical protein
MKLYIVMESDRGYGCFPVKVFSSREKAEKYINEGSGLYLEEMSEGEVDIC